MLPFALRLTLASAVGMDRAIEQAAVSLGASDWTVFRRITLPLILPGLIERLGARLHPVASTR